MSIQSIRPSEPQYDPIQRTTELQNKKLTTVSQGADQLYQFAGTNQEGYQEVHQYNVNDMLDNGLASESLDVLLLATDNIRERNKKLIEKCDKIDNQIDTMPQRMAEFEKNMDEAYAFRLQRHKEFLRNQPSKISGFFEGLRKSISDFFTLSGKK